MTWEDARNDSENTVIPANAGALAGGTPIQKGKEGEAQSFNPSNPGSDNRVGQGYNGENRAPPSWPSPDDQDGGAPFLFPVRGKVVALVVGGVPSLPPTVVCR